MKLLGREIVFTKDLETVDNLNITLGSFDDYVVPLKIDIQLGLIDSMLDKNGDEVSVVTINALNPEEQSILNEILENMQS